MRKLWFSVAVAVLAMLPAIYFRVTDWRPDPILDAMVFGAAILAAGFMLSWGAETAEGQISAGLILAVVAIITVLPEYAVDIYYAWRAGQAPQSDYVHYAAANMTGANRLLVGIAWPLLVLLHWWRTRSQSIQLAPVNSVEILFLLIPSLYAFSILMKDSISFVDSILLIAIFIAYLWRVGSLPKVEEEGEDEDEEVGLAAEIEKLPVRRQWALMGGLALTAATVIFVSAEPFAEAMIDSGRILGIDEFLLIQWLAPLASEAPAVTVAILFVLSNRAAAGLTTMISDKINQWTLLVGMLPLAMSVGAGSLMALPLDARQHEEFFLTAAQSLFGLALLLRLRLGIGGAIALSVLFSAQIGLAFTFRDDEALTIRTLTWLGWGYLALAAAIVAMNWKGLKQILFTAARPHQQVRAQPASAER
ncbi:Sodium/calcium exchanger family protein [Sphingopyxis sp. LC81]|jgi:cation:H+ antiporter|uniref:sodium:proton exchanger n=1 Tax=Sphingopyxis sp. LC81 TaxID=1502850 RepID=UPI00050F41D5|nr:sodium:proton exchanger [Sphingopyxis sp. LC81]KGB54694.1 Sodium/calcium exchanger family protein [Sphingopyxis sp. LC81]